LKEEALARTAWRTRFGSGGGAVVRHKRVNEVKIFVLLETSLAYSVISQVPITDEGLSSRVEDMTRSCPIRAGTK
jgi:hypothetical protein